MGRHVCNFVHNDEIWKDYVRREMQSAARKWPENWGFLYKVYRNMNQELIGQEAAKDSQETEKIRVPARERAEEKEKPLKLPPINGASDSFPNTTAKLIGWKSANSESRLDKYGKYEKARGKKSILKVFNWPQQGL